MGACGMRPGKETCRSWTAEHTRQGPKGGGGGGSLEPWSPEIFVVEPGAQSLALLGTQTKNAVFG